MAEQIQIEYILDALEKSETRIARLTEVYSKTISDNKELESSLGKFRKENELLKDRINYLEKELDKLRNTQFSGSLFDKLSFGERKVIREKLDEFIEKINKHIESI